MVPLALFCDRVVSFSRIVLVDFRAPLPSTPPPPPPRCRACILGNFPDAGCHFLSRRRHCLQVASYLLGCCCNYIRLCCRFLCTHSHLVAHSEQALGRTRNPLCAFGNLGDEALQFDNEYVEPFPHLS